MNRPLLLASLLTLCSPVSPVFAFGREVTLCEVNARLAGVVVDHTANNGRDRRIWSPALGERRDLYVYLPPGFDPACRYPVMVWLHGIVADERQFVQYVIPDLDAAIVAGRLPPLIIAMPDGTVEGRTGIFTTHSAFLDSRLGRYEEYLLTDVWNFLLTHYPIRPEREAHVLAGVSMGGGSAFRHALHHRDVFAYAVGIYPPLNTRWRDCHGDYFGNFDPCCWGWRTRVGPGCEAVGKFGAIRVPIRRLVHPLYGRGPQAIVNMSLQNPLEMLDRYNVNPGEIDMFVAYGALDEFNLDAQIESFVYRARQRGLSITVLRDPQGRHNIDTALKFLPATIDWLAARIGPYSPR